MPTTHENRVSILIAEREFAHWEKVTIHRQMDSFSTIEFDAPFESKSRAFRNAFRPFSFQTIEALVDGERVLTGRLVGVNPRRDAASSRVSVSGYAYPGMLADCTAPEDSLPLEFKGLSLRAIATQLAEPFGIEVRFDAPEGGKFAKAKAEVDEHPYDFLGKLARQRGLVLTSDADGVLVFQQATASGSPVVRMQDDQRPVTEVTATFGPQSYYSHITGFAKHKRGRLGSRYTVRNPWLTDVLRPLAFKLDDTDPGDAPSAAAAKLGRMFANAVSYAVQLATWRDPAGKLWAPNTTVTLLAPDLMVYRETELLVRAVTLTQEKDVERATLNLILPGTFTGQIPEALPWDE